MKTSTLFPTFPGVALPISLLLCLLGLNASAKAQSLVNGDFTSSLTGWTTQGSNTQWVRDLGPDGISGVMWINDIPGVAFGQQTITGLTSGQTYQVSGFYKSHTLFFGPGSFTAQIDGIVQFTNPDTAFVNSWTPFSFNFTSSSSSALLRLDSQVGNDSDYSVDKISVTSKVVVPETGSLALFASAITMGGCFLQRRIKRDRITEKKKRL